MKHLLKVLLAFFIFFAPAQAAFASQPGAKPAAKTSAETPAVSAGKQQIKELKKELKEKIKEAKKSGQPADTDLFLKVLLCLILPPLAVYLHEGVTNRFWIDLVLLLLGPISCIYALYVVLAG